MTDNGKDFHLDPVEWGRHTTLMAEVHTALLGDGGCLTQLKTLNGRVRTLEQAKADQDDLCIPARLRSVEAWSWVYRIGGSGVLMILGYLARELLDHLHKG